MFRLVTWNIQSGRSPEGKTDLDRIIACLERFCSFDMLCVQEVSSAYTEAGEDQFAMLRERLPGYTGIECIACDTALPGGRAGRRRFGMMVFSRHPVLQAQRHSLPWAPEPGVMGMPRTALELTVDAPGGLLRVIGVHLEYFSQRQRMAQVERLRELHREASQHARCPQAAGNGPFAPTPRALPALLAGDFNMLPGSPEHPAPAGPVQRRHPTLARLLAPGPARAPPCAHRGPARPPPGSLRTLHLRLCVRQRRPGRTGSAGAGRRQRTGVEPPGPAGRARLGRLSTPPPRHRTMAVWRRLPPNSNTRPHLDWDYPHPFTLPVTPQPGDIDGLNHTNNAVYVRWCEQAGWAHSHRLGLTLDDYRRLDRAMAIRRGDYDYLLPTVLGEALLLSTWLTAGDGKLAMERRFQLRRESDGATVLRGRWDLVCIEIASGRPRRMPAEFLDAYMPAVALATGTEQT